MANPSETLVRWYLRFNGYLTVDNLVVHEPTEGAVPQGAEFDVIGVRFPFSREVADFELPRDPHLGSIETSGATNVVVGEVKGGRDATLSEVWLPEANDALQCGRVAYLIRWLGLWESEADIQKVARDLRHKRATDNTDVAIRVVYFGARPSAQADDLGVPSILLRDIADWIVTTRASCWRDREVAKRSCHDQWDLFIKNVWNLADPELPGTIEGKVASILALATGRAIP